MLRMTWTKPRFSPGKAPSWKRIARLWASCRSATRPTNNSSCIGCAALSDGSPGRPTGAPQRSEVLVEARREQLAWDQEEVEGLTCATTDIRDGSGWSPRRSHWQRPRPLYLGALHSAPSPGRSADIPAPRVQPGPPRQRGSAASLTTAVRTSRGGMGWCRRSIRLAQLEQCFWKRHFCSMTCTHRRECYHYIFGFG